MQRLYSRREVDETGRMRPTMYKLMDYPSPNKNMSERGQCIMYTTYDIEIDNQTILSILMKQQSKCFKLLPLYEEGEE